MTIPDDNSFVNGGKIKMSVRTRIETIRLLEKMEQHEAYSKKIGLSDVSELHGEVVNIQSRIKEEHYEF